MSLGGAGVHLTRGNKNDFAALIAHEMQHALDHNTEGIMLDFDQALAAYGSQQPSDAELESMLETYITDNVETEVRAYERQDAILDHRAYADDGQLSEADINTILGKGLGNYENYEAYYEAVVSQFSSLDTRGYDVDIRVTDGKVDVVLIKEGNS